MCPHILRLVRTNDPQPCIRMPLGKGLTSLRRINSHLLDNGKLTLLIIVKHWPTLN